MYSTVSKLLTMLALGSWLYAFVPVLLLVLGIQDIFIVLVFYSIKTTTVQSALTVSE